jgi:hypothetical protein
MVSIYSLIVCMIIILLFIPIKSNIVYKKRKNRNPIAEFDLTPEENRHAESTFAKKIGEKLETQLGRGYELLAHSMCMFSSYSNQKIC